MQAARASLGSQKVSLEDLSEAERSIIAFCQQQRFSSEITALRSGKPVPKNSTIQKLDPILDEGLLRVGGRLNRAAMPEDLRE